MSISTEAPARARRPRGLVAQHHPTDRRRPVARAAACLRVPHPRPRRLQRGHRRAHHLGRATTARCSSTRGACGGTRSRLPTSAGSTTTATCSRASGTSRRRSTSTPSCTGAAAMRGWWCTTTRTTWSSWPRIGMLPEIVHQTRQHVRRRSDASSRSTPARSTTRRSAPSWPTRSARRNVDPGQPRHHRHRRDDRGGDATDRPASTGMCRLAYDVLLDRGRTPLPIAGLVQGRHADARCIERGSDVYSGPARCARCCATEPDVLD